MKQKLESLCRELQRQNKMVQVSGFWKPEGCEAASGPAMLYPVCRVLYRRSLLFRSVCHISFYQSELGTSSLSSGCSLFKRKALSGASKLLR
jgi:hypothetical protein